MTALAQIVIVDGLDQDGADGRWDLSADHVIGRSTDADITLNVAAVSRRHALITKRPTGFWLEDLGSSNGTFVNSHRVNDEPVLLNDADQIVIAGAVVLKFVDLLATPMAPAIGRLRGLWIDPETRAVWIDARRVDPPLSERQLLLLELLYDNAGDIVTRADAVDHVWSDVAAAGVTDDALAALIKRLRARLADFEIGEPHLEIVKSRGIRVRIQPGD